MFDEFNPSRKKRSVATRYEDAGLTRAKCSISFGGGGGGGGSTQSTATSYNTNIPEYAQPYVQTMLNATQQQLFNINDKGQVTGFAPYRAYGGTYDQAGNMTAYNPAAGIAGFTPLQQQVQENIANLQVPTQFGAASDLSAAAGQGGLDSTRAAYGYGAQGAAYGAQGAQLGIQGGQRFGESGYQSGMLGQQLGVSGGEYYGGMGADYGAQAAALSGEAQRYGAAGQAAGLRGEALANQYAQQAAQQGNIYGAQAAALAPQAQAYGQTAADIGRMGLEAQTYGRDVGEQARQYAAQSAAAGQQYAQQATSPAAVQAYMSPYQQAVTDVQKQAAEREFAVQNQARRASAARAGAYGGARQAIEQAEAQRNLNTQLQAIQATGSQAAYDRALQSMQYGTSTGLQGLQGAQAGLGTALQGGQLGLSGIGQAMAGQQAGVSALGQAGNLYGVGLQGAGMGISAGQLGLSGAQTGIQGAQAGLQGIGQAGAMYGLGMQGAQTGLQGVQAQLAGTAQGMQGAQVGLQGVDRQLAGTAQGMQGAQVGLQGVQGAQAGYGLANQAAGTLGSLGTQQLAAQQGILGLQSQAGAQQQAYQQQILNQAMQDYANAQQYPLMQLGTLSNMLRGLPMQSTTTQQYVAQPNLATQAIGTAGSLGSLYQAFKAKGGIIDAKKYAAGGSVESSVEAKLYDMQPEQLQKELQSPSGEIRKMAKRILMEKSIEGKAGGGIIAFAGGTPDPEILPEERERTATDVQYAAPTEQNPRGIVAAPTPAPAIPSRIDTSPAGLKRAGADLYAQQAAKATRPVADIAAERQAFIGPDTAGQEYRKKIMEERANAGDEAVRQNWLRAAAFFADWGSRPGNTLAAGMLALKNTIPDAIADQKEQKKYLREIDRTLYDLDKAARAEKAGDFDKAAEIQQKAGDNAFKVFGNLSDIARTEISAGATVAAANAGGGRTTDLMQAYNVALGQMTGGDPSKATPDQKAKAMAVAANQLRGTETRLGIQQSDAETKALKEDEELKGLISKKKMLSINPKMAEKNAAAIEKLEDDIAAQEARVLARARRQPQPAAAPEPTGASPAKTVSFGDLPK